MLSARLHTAGIKLVRLRENCSAFTDALIRISSIHKTGVTNQSATVKRPRKDGRAVKCRQMQRVTSHWEDSFSLPKFAAQSPLKSCSRHIFTNRSCVILRSYYFVYFFSCFSKFVDIKIKVINWWLSKIN